MATWLPHLKLEIGGNLGVPAVDIWSNTVRFKIEDDDDPEVPSQLPRPEQLDAILFVMGQDIVSWFQDSDSLIGQNAILTYAKLNAITATGKQREVETHRIDLGPTSGPVGNPMPHWFVTAALTMRTEKARGRAHSGRIFPPCVGAPPQGQTPYISVTAAGLMGENFATALNTWSSKIATAGSPTTTDVYPVVASPLTTVGPNPGPALLQRVTAIAVDRVADVQHRRTNRVPRLEGNRQVIPG